MYKKIPIGDSDFRYIITDNQYYIDKSLLIKDIENAGKSLLVTRPRRFGKTLNMMMLKYFYDVNEDNRELFSGLKIEVEEGGKYMEKCGKHPVIFLSFKDLKNLTWESMYIAFLDNLIYSLKPFAHILKDSSLPEDDFQLFQKLFSETIEPAHFNGLLKSLCRVLFQYYDKKVVILIDEYDTPVIASYTQDYYKQMINLIRNFLSSGLKDNPYLEKGILTGITRIATCSERSRTKESLFSGLNNFEVFSIFDSKMSDKFGFTQDEVHVFLEEYGILGKEEAVKLWYNNYQFGEVEIYNPWSIINFINNNGKTFDTFWVNTSDNALVRELMFNKANSIRNELEALIRGEWLHIRLEKNLSFLELETKIHAVWNVLLFAGYLTFSDIEYSTTLTYCKVKIPNYEVNNVFHRFIQGWIETQIRDSEHEDMLAALLLGEVLIFKKIFKRFVEAVFSFHDTAGTMPEKFYHAFILGLMVKLEASYHILSNREIGYGRADICLIPKKDKNKLGIIIEIKAPDKSEKETLEMGLEMAEKQTITRNYAAIMLQYEIPNFIAIAIAVQGKKCLVKQVMLP